MITKHDLIKVFVIAMIVAISINISIAISNHAIMKQVETMVDQKLNDRLGPHQDYTN